MLLETSPVELDAPDAVSLMFSTGSLFSSSQS